MSDPADTAIERMRARIGRPLGASLRDRRGVSDGVAPLDGEWLGGFAQPSVVLNEVSAMSAQLANQGTMRDEYGESSVTVVALTPEKLELRKSYARSGAEFVYVAQRSAATLAGYWYAPKNKAFRGVFCLVRADALGPDDERALRNRVRTTSPRRIALLVASAAVVAAFAWGALGHDRVLALGALAVFCAFQVVVYFRLSARRREADAWRELLG